MALPRKRSRLIEVDGRRYRWLPIYARVTWCEAPCSLRLAVQSEGGRGQKLVAVFDGQVVVEGQVWVRPRYGSEVTPAVVEDVIRAGLAAGWEPEATRRPPLVLEGERFLRLPEG